MIKFRNIDLYSRYTFSIKMTFFLSSGYKTFTNEFIAYEQLGRLIENTEAFQNYNGSWVQINDDIYLTQMNQTLFGGVMQVYTVHRLLAYQFS